MALTKSCAGAPEAMPLPITAELVVSNMLPEAGLTRPGSTLYGAGLFPLAAEHADQVTGVESLGVYTKLFRMFVPFVPYREQLL